MSKTFWVAVILTTIILGISAGILVHIYSDMKLENSNLEHLARFNEIREENKTLIANANDEVKTTPNTEIVFEIYYNKCGHTSVKKVFVSEEDVNKNEEQIAQKYKEWKIRSFTKDMIELYKEENKMCDNHYIVKDNEGKIAIYKIDENDNETLIEDTEISTKYLPQEDLELLKKGIRANNNNKLQEILSDYE